MTNREWLNSLSDEDFAKWCVSKEVDTLVYYDLPCVRFDEPTPRLDTLKGLFTSSSAGLLKWLKEERK